MAILFIDGFDHYATAEITRKWDRAGGFETIQTANPRRTGSGYLRISAGTSSRHVSKILSGTPNTVVMGFAIRIGSYAGHQGIVRLYRKGSVTCSVQIAADGSIEVRRGSYNGTLIEASAAAVIPINAWTYIEAKIYIHDSAGTYEVRVNGISIVDGTGVDTKAEADAGADMASIFSPDVSGENIDIDDLYIDDADFQGNCRVDTLWPSGAGNYAQWTPSPSGTDNHNNVDDATDQDDDTTHNETGVLNEIDSFAFDNIDAILGSEIKAVAVNLATRKTDAGARKITPLMRMGGSDYLGTEVDIFDTYMTLQEVFENPLDALSEAWEDSDVNDAEVGLKLTT